MILLDTMVIVYARQPASPFHQWALDQVSEAVVSDAAGISVASLAELCAEDGVDSAEIAREINSLGIHILDITASAAAICGEAYRKYRHTRKRTSGKDSPKIPLPDFFIGAQAQSSGWTVVTNDAQRFRTYFPKVQLITPPS